MKSGNSPVFPFYDSESWKVHSTFCSDLWSAHFFLKKYTKCIKCIKCKKMHLCTSEHFCVVCFSWKHYWWTFVLKVQKVYKVHRVHRWYTRHTISAHLCTCLPREDILCLARRTIKVMVIRTPPRVYLSYEGTGGRFSGPDMHLIDCSYFHFRCLAT